MYICVFVPSILNGSEGRQENKGGKEGVQSRQDSLDLNLHSHGNTIALLPPVYHHTAEDRL